MAHKKPEGFARQSAALFWPNYSERDLDNLYIIGIVLEHTGEQTRIGQPDHGCISWKSDAGYKTLTWGRESDKLDFTVTYVVHDRGATTVKKFKLPTIEDIAYLLSTIATDKEVAQIKRDIEALIQA